jgi:hypothetical protein
MKKFILLFAIFLNLTGLLCATETNTQIKQDNNTIEPIINSYSLFVHEVQKSLSALEEKLKTKEKYYIAFVLELKNLLATVNEDINRLKSLNRDDTVAIYKILKDREKIILENLEKLESFKSFKTKEETFWQAKKQKIILMTLISIAICAELFIITASYDKEHKQWHSPQWETFAYNIQTLFS